jgi:hypothetical protein
VRLADDLAALGGEVGDEVVDGGENLGAVVGDGGGGGVTVHGGDLR